MRKGPSRLVRTVRSLGAMVALGAGLAIYSSVMLARDVAAATGPHGESQHAFLAGAADRPDIELFYKGLSHSQRITMAARIGEYDDPKMADLAGALLGTFDTGAREALVRSLVRLGKTQPDTVASQIKRPGSLQEQAVMAALRQLGPAVLPMVVHQMTSGGGKNAETYLIANGKPAVPFLLPVLDDRDAGNRQLAADALGKIGAREAAAKIAVLYSGAKGDERFGYLSALASLGGPENEGLLRQALISDGLTNAQRAQVMTGLGKIGSPTAISVLWPYAQGEDPNLTSAAISALQLAGSSALSLAPSDELGLRVAEGIRGNVADAYVAACLTRPASRLLAARAASDRPLLIRQLVSLARSAGHDGEVVDAAMEALSTTSEGRQAMNALQADPLIGGFAYRRASLAH